MFPLSFESKPGLAGSGAKERKLPAAEAANEPAIIFLIAFRRSCFTTIVKYSLNNKSYYTPLTEDSVKASIVLLSFSFLKNTKNNMVTTPAIPAGISQMVCQLCVVSDNL